MFNDFENRSNSFGPSSFESDYFFLKNSTLGKSDRFYSLELNDDVDYRDGDWRFFGNRRRNCFSFSVFGFVIVCDFENKVWSLHFSVVGFIISVIVLVLILSFVFGF